MSLLSLTPRTLQETDWATALFVLTFVLIALSRSFFEKRFGEYIRLAVSDKYLKVYKDPGQLNSAFTTLLFVIQLISLSFFIQITLDQAGFADKTDWVTYIRIFTLTSAFILSKYLIDKIIGVAFKIEEVLDQFNLRKLSYRSYLGLLLLPVNIVLFYNDFDVKSAIWFCIAAILTINVLTYLVSLKNYQNFIVSKLFYFILYLCTLEIAPYYFLYYWFTKFSKLEI